MFDFFNTNFMPHGGCYLWHPGILWTHVLSDAVIGLSYFSIPLVLVVFVRRRKDLAFSWIFIMFAAFILFCGATHLMEIWTTWQPFYWSEGLVKVATALVSAGTAIALWPLLPRALSLPSPSQLRNEVQQRKQAENQLRELNQELERKVEQRTEELEQFIYAASHDLQEPLRVLKTYTEALGEDLEKTPSDVVEEDIRFIRRSADRMQKQMKSLLKLSRVSRQELEFESIPLEECVDEALLNLKQKIEETGAEIERIELPEVTGDPALITDLYQNLLSNALKYHGNAPPRIELTADREEDHWILGVRDQGPGIDPEHQDDIFNPFVHLESWDEYEGTGIGLSIARRILERHGGEIWVESEPGNGAHFKFTLTEARS